jgi:hypothetical protein
MRRIPRAARLKMLSRMLHDIFKLNKLVCLKYLNGSYMAYKSFAIDLDTRYASLSRRLLARVALITLKLTSFPPT